MIKFGTILKPVGLKGEVRVFSDSDFLEERLKKGHQFITSKNVLTVQKASIDSNVHKVKFMEINSIEEAEKFRQIDLMLESLDDALLAEDEFYIQDLLDCEVYQEQEYLGKVIEVLEQVAHPVLRIGSVEDSFLVPFNHQFVPEIDLDNKRINVELIEGMR